MRCSRLQDGTSCCLYVALKRELAEDATPELGAFARQRRDLSILPISEWGGAPVSSNSLKSPFCPRRASTKRHKPLPSLCQANTSLTARTTAAVLQLKHTKKMHSEHLNTRCALLQVTAQRKRASQGTPPPKVFIFTATKRICHQLARCLERMGGKGDAIQRCTWSSNTVSLASIVSKWNTVDCQHTHTH